MVWSLSFLFYILFTFTFLIHLCLYCHSLFFFSLGVIFFFWELILLSHFSCFTLAHHWKKKKPSRILTYLRSLLGLWENRNHMCPPKTYHVMFSIQFIFELYLVNYKKTKDRYNILTFTESSTPSVISAYKILLIGYIILQDNTVLQFSCQQNIKIIYIPHRLLK